MTKSSIKQLNEDENKILAELQANCRENIDTIAKHCGFSRQKVWRLIKKLEEEKKIWGYAAITDEETNDLKHYILLIQRSSAPLQESHKKELIFEKVDKYLPGMVKVDDVYYTHGVHDLMITFFAHDITNAKKFAQEVFEKNRNMLKDYTILQTLFPIRMKGFKNPQMKKIVEFI